MEYTEDKPEQKSSVINTLMTTGLSGLKTTVILIAEICIVLAIGAYAGNIFNSKAIVEDCQRVNLAKVGDAFVNCTIVVPKKDPEPR
jgi:hypothetical protein